MKSQKAMQAEIKKCMLHVTIPIEIEGIIFYKKRQP